MSNRSVDIDVILVQGWEQILCSGCLEAIRPLQISETTCKIQKDKSTSPSAHVFFVFIEI